MLKSSSLYLAFILHYFIAAAAVTHSVSLNLLEYTFDLQNNAATWNVRLLGLLFNHVHAVHLLGSCTVELWPDNFSYLFAVLYISFLQLLCSTKIELSVFCGGTTRAVNF